MNNLRLNPDPKHRPLLRLIELQEATEWPLFTNITVGESDWEILKDNNIPGNAEQREFVIKALSTPDFAILEGPPGSGKTTAICEFILQAIKRNKRILLCASTHVAVDNVLERLTEDFNDLVIPVRIGDESNISEQIQKFQYGRFKNTERDRLIKFLINEKKNNRELLPSQEILLQSLQEKDKHTIEDLILESANLICGTTIGILNFQGIKEMGRKGTKKPSPQFDYLIIDEASKTTFQEFLVPAIFAKKWIITGDPKQLSPYVDEKEISANVEKVLPINIPKEACLDIFNCYKSINWKNNRRSLLVTYNDKKIREIYYERAKELGLEVFQINEDWRERISQNDLEINLLASDVIISDINTIKEIEEILPSDIDFIRGDFMEFESKKLRIKNNSLFLPEPTDFKNIIITSMPRYNRRREFWKKKELKERKKHHFSKAEDSWADSVTWRLSRSFSLRNMKNQELVDKYEEEIDLLLPKWIKNKNGNDNSDQKNNEDSFYYNPRRLNFIRQIALPSIIEVLREGFPKRFQYYASTTLSDGFQERDLKPRHVLLSYQHRMHSEISRFPREQFYNESSLIDNPFLDKTRNSEWKYKKYDHKIVWKNVNGKVHRKYNRNEKEANEVIRELKNFVNWAKNNPKIIQEKSGLRKGSWEVAVLTFYRPQELLLREKIRKLLKNHRAYQTFETKNVKISVCTVDRFQGHEADLVLLSFVQVGYIGFLDSPNRLNVALTRARNQLVIFGFHKYFESNRHRSDLLRNLAKETEYALLLK